MLYDRPMMRLSRWLRREWLSLIFGAIASALTINCIRGPRGARDLADLRGHRMALEAQLRRLSSENAEMETTVSKLRSDDRYLEHVVRGELGFARPDELVYRFSSDDGRAR